MRHPRLSLALLLAGCLGILAIWFGASGQPGHGGSDSAVLIGASAPGGTATPTAGVVHDHHSAAAPVPTTTPAPTPTPEQEQPSPTAPGSPDSPLPPVDDSTDQEAPLDDPVDGTDQPPSPAPEDPNAPAADRRQVGLAEAATNVAGLSTAPAAEQVYQGVDADAVGVNDGSKRQATDVTMQPAPIVNPSDVLPTNGLVNGCVAGYGRGVQCLPQTPPSHAAHAASSREDMSGYWTCAEARTLLPDGIVVDSPAGDPLRLDSNKDGTACGAGDA